MDQVQNRDRSKTYLLIPVVGLAVVAYFIKPPYSYYLFLGAIFAICWEISDRLREQFYVHSANQEVLHSILKELEKRRSSNE